MSFFHPPETNNGAVTSWVPLMTPWASVPSCSNSLMLEGSRLVAFDPGYGISINPAATCQPPAVTTWWNQGRLGGGSGVGHTAVSILPLVCPEGFSTAATSVKDSSSTLAICCPPGYILISTAPGSVNGDCISGVQKGMVLTFASTPSTDSNTWTIASTTLGASSTIGAIGVIGWNVNLAAATVTTSQYSIASSSTNVSSSQSSSTSPPSSGLSTGAGVGLGVAVIVALVVLAAAFWISHRRKAITVAEPSSAIDRALKPELDGNPVRALHELQAPPLVHELQSHQEI